MKTKEESYKVLATFKALDLANISLISPIELRFYLEYFYWVLNMDKEWKEEMYSEIPNDILIYRKGKEYKKVINSMYSFSNPPEEFDEEFFQNILITIQIRYSYFNVPLRSYAKIWYDYTLRKMEVFKACTLWILGKEYSLNLSNYPYLELLTEILEYNKDKEINLSAVPFIDSIYRVYPTIKNDNFE